jgi:hypothetical protein
MLIYFLNNRRLFNIHFPSKVVDILLPSLLIVDAWQKPGLTTNPRKKYFYFCGTVPTREGGGWW